MQKKVLPKDFYTHGDVLKISRNLIGKFLCTNFDNALTSGIIVETEAYRAPEDKASHACGGRRTKRNESMYAEGGVCYIYHCYGLHALFNVVTNVEGIPHAVLIRAIAPIDGIQAMEDRRRMSAMNKALTSGPGKLTQALGIETVHNGYRLDKPPIWIEEREPIFEGEIVETTRIGVDYAGEHALLPWRFYLKGSKWVSKK